jgi:signal transduction histidine kinase
MPGTRRSAGQKYNAPRRTAIASAATAAMVTALPAHAQVSTQVSTPVSAQAGDQISTFLSVLSDLDGHEIAALALIVGAVVFAVVTAILLMRTHTRTIALENGAHEALARLQGEVDRLHGLLLSESMVLVSWPAAGDDAEVIGDVSLLGSAGADPLAPQSWLDGEHARSLAAAIARLRADGEGFDMRLTTLAGRHLKAEGRAVAGSAVMKLRDVAGIEAELASLTSRHDKLRGDAEALTTLAAALPTPLWVRDRLGRLTFVNNAYARAVDASDPADAIARGLELLDREERDEIAVAGQAAFTGRLPAIVAGTRRMLDIVHAPCSRGSAGLGIDVTQEEHLRTELMHMGEAHRRTLDQLPTAVAIFGADRRLTFYNQAYQKLFNLEAAFLDDEPSDSVVLDRLRGRRSLPEQQDFRQWKKELHEAYHAIEPTRHEWHLPDNRTLRVVTTPNPEGGVTYLIDDVTERLNLERRFDSLTHVQGETLDNLAEGIAVFGSNGRVRLCNPAFLRMWRLDTALLSKDAHIETVIDLCRPLHRDEATWQALRTAVTVLDQRAPISQRIERNDGSVVDCATVPLPDGGTLTAFQDVTDSVNVERALRERNEALIAADELKIDFVHHVSYELRSPLTNIIGFAHFLGDPSTGPLTSRQREYLHYITVSTNALLAIIDNILDLATIDAGAMKLNLSMVDILRTMEAAVEGVQDRLVNDGLKLELSAAPGIGSFIADEWRLRQVLFNLLSNAIGFSPPRGIVRLAAERHPDAVVFSVSDTGPGIPIEMKDKVFDWFESHSLGSQHRGTGLGLSLVRSFVELHGGTVTIDSQVGQGTTVVCTFPADQAAERTAAE